jgi:hypothetical protein
VTPDPAPNSTTTTTVRANQKRVRGSFEQAKIPSTVAEAATIKLANPNGAPSKETKKSTKPNRKTVSQTTPTRAFSNRKACGKQRVRSPEDQLAAGKQWVLQTGKQRVSARQRPFVDYSAMHVAPPVNLPPEDNLITIDDETDQFFAWFEEQERLAEQRVRNQEPRHGPTPSLAFHADAFPPAMPASDLPPIFPTGPLNLNIDGTEISYRKSHADGEESERMERKFKDFSQQGQSNPSVLLTSPPTGW